MPDSNSTQERKNLFKTWLETLQQESWQLELLISGLALFGVFEAKALIDDLEHFLDIQFFGAAVSFIVEIFMFLIKGSWYIFLINLTIHFVLRGLWIGAIGLRYVSNDINYEDLGFSTYFKKLFTRRYESFDDYIEDLEKICSVIFAYTFLLFFILISACLITLWPIVMLKFLGQSLGLLLVFFYLLFGLIVLIDFVFLNPLKKVEDKWISRIFGLLFRFYSTISLSFIFRPLLLNFLDNKFTKRLFLFSIPYGIIIILVFPQLTFESQKYFPEFGISSLEYRAYYTEAFNARYYDNLREKGDQKIGLISLREDKVKGDLLDVFLILLRSDNAYIDEKGALEAINKTGLFWNFRKKSALDSAYQAMSDRILLELTEFIDNRENNQELYSAEEWDIQYQSMLQRHDDEKSALFKSKASKIKDLFTSQQKFFIDSIEVTSEVECLMYQHENLGEKGWRCLIGLDSLTNGLHQLGVHRGVYDRRNKMINHVKLEIPFILDR